MDVYKKDTKDYYGTTMMESTMTIYMKGRFTPNDIKALVCAYGNKPMEEYNDLINQYENAYYKYIKELANDSVRYSETKDLKITNFKQGEEVTFTEGIYP